MVARDSGPEPAVVALVRTAMERGLAALAEQDVVSALRWLDRAHRLAPHDPNTKLTLATACLGTDPSRAAVLFAEVTGKHDVRQAWLGLAAARLRLAEPDAAAESLVAVLSRHAFAPDTAGLAQQIAGRLGWCGVRSDGSLEIHPASSDAVRVTLDEKPVRGTKLPGGWARGHSVDIRCAGAHLVGSPIQISAVRRLAGCVEVWNGGLRGWAWHPGDPSTAPVLTLTYVDGSEQTLVARDESVTVQLDGPLARPRTFHLTRDDLPIRSGLVHVRGPDGTDIPGSPLDPCADAASHVAAASRIGLAYSAEGFRRTFDENAPSPAPLADSSVTPLRARTDSYVTPLRADSYVTPLRADAPVTPLRARTDSYVTPLRADAPPPARPVGAQTRRRAPTVVIPVHDGGPVVLACLTSVLASRPDDARVLVIDDGSSDPTLIAKLDDLARQRKITLRRHPRPLGFPASANAGIRAASGRDVVLLNSDTLVPPDWLRRLRDAAYSAPDIGTVTPLSNDASILSYPVPSGTNPQPDQAETNRLDRLAVRANGASVIDIPVGVGFCLYLRRDCLNATGLFRADVFAQGYGEENDLCLRATRLGWRHVALSGLFVGHLGGATFGASAAHLRQRNGRIVEQLHPGHQALIAAFVAADPLAGSRRRIDLLAWQQRGRAGRPSAILITHDEGGGVERRLKRSTQAHAAAGRRPILLRPLETTNGEPAITVRDGLIDDLPNLIFAVPRELPALLRLLRAAKADRIEAHHLAGHPPAIYDLIAQLGLPYDVHVHDYAWFCPRISLVAAHNRYCGEPDLRDCEACVADNGSLLREPIGVAALRQRSAGFLAQARHVVVPADDVGIRMRRYFSTLSTITVPHEDDAAPIARVGSHAARPARPKICVVGAIGVHKGYEVLLACARDAERRDLDLEFVVVGHTIDDSRVMATGRVFVTGEFDPDEAVRLIAAQHASLGFVPSICPETWCLGLGDLWRAGLPAAAFDIGAPAERIRRAGGGIVLPLGLSANAINNRLVAAIRAAGH
jgi:GT2 family glycosyltransferase/glycosyltransferase involved in cell wall biosynthesis